jgi:hypothetical protein
MHQTRRIIFGLNSMGKNREESSGFRGNILETIAASVCKPYNEDTSSARIV